VLAWTLEVGRAPVGACWRGNTDCRGIPSSGRCPRTCSFPYLMDNYASDDSQNGEHQHTERYRQEGQPPPAVRMPVPSSIPARTEVYKQNVHSRVLRRDPPLKHHSTRTGHRKQIAVPTQAPWRRQSARRGGGGSGMKSSRSFTNVGGSASPGDQETDTTRCHRKFEIAELRRC